jgi:hypothetical protein
MEADRLSRPDLRSCIYPACYIIQVGGLHRCTLIEPSRSAPQIVEVVDI